MPDTVTDEGSALKAGNGAALDALAMKAAVQASARAALAVVQVKFMIDPCGCHCRVAARCVTGNELQFAGQTDSRRNDRETRG
jgi:hypothetical protein